MFRDATVFARAVTLLVPLALALPLAALDPPGDPAPRFRARSIAGETFTNASVKGRYVLLQFWTTWCPYCRGDQQSVEEIVHRYSPDDLVVLGVDVNESRIKVARYLARSPRSVKVVLTQNTNLAALFQATTFPLYVLIDRNGNLAGTLRGAAGTRGLERFLQKAGLKTPQ